MLPVGSPILTPSTQLAISSGCGMFDIYVRFHLFLCHVSRGMVGSSAPVPRTVMAAYFTSLSHPRLPRHANIYPTSSPPLIIIIMIIMASLLACPNETLSHIIAYLNTIDLLSVSRASHRLHNVSLPLLYRAPISHATGVHKVPGLPCPLHTPLTIPALATHVNSLELQLESWAYAIITPRDTQVPHVSIRKQRAQTQALQLLQLLRILPRLTHLDLWPPYEPYSNDSVFAHFHSRLTAAPPDPAGLQSLREFRSAGNDAVGITPMILVALMALPLIRTIAVTIDDHWRRQFALDLAHAAAGLSGITDLELLFSDLALPLLATLLAVPRALARFQLLTLRTETRFHTPAFGRSLVVLAPSLRYLSVRFARTHSSHLGDEQHGGIGSLASWHSLETLECPLVALLGQFPVAGQTLLGILPRGVRALRVWQDAFWHTEDLAEILLALREVTLLFADFMDPQPSVMERTRRMHEVENAVVREREIARLRCACETAGVAFGMQRVTLDREGLLELGISDAQYRNYMETWLDDVYRGVS